MGAFAGAALAHSPSLSVLDAKVFGKTIAFIVIAPTLGMIIAFALTKLVRKVFGHMRPGRVDKGFRRGQLLSAALYSLGHGGNDAQKTMGIITLLLISAGLQQSTKHPEPREAADVVFAPATRADHGDARPIRRRAHRIRSKITARP